MRVKGLTSYQLKWIAIVFMVVDHINSYFGMQLGLPSWVSWLGRFVAPLFVFLLVEGFKYTHSKYQYAKRLGIAAFVVAIGNIIYHLLTGNYINEYNHQPNYYLFLGPHNIFLTLFLLFCLMWLLSTIKGKTLWKKGMLVAVALLLVMITIAFSEGGLYLVPMLLLMYFFREKKERGKLILGIFVYTLILFYLAILTYTQMPDYQSLYQFLTFDNEFMMVTVIPFIILYNGKLGGTGRAFDKYFFYLFYPLHLWIIYLILSFIN